MVHVVRAGVREEWKTEATKIASTGAGAFAGFGISEFTGEFITRYTDMTGGTKLAAKSIVRVLFAVLFIGLSYMTGGILSWFLFAASAGSFGGVFMDLVEFFKAGGVKGMAQEMAMRAKGARITREAAERVVETFTVESPSQVVVADGGDELAVYA